MAKIILEIEAIHAAGTVAFLSKMLEETTARDPFTARVYELAERTRDYITHELSEQADVNQLQAAFAELKK